MMITIDQPTRLHQLTVTLSTEVFSAFPLYVQSYDEAKSVAKLETLIRKVFLRQYEQVNIEYCSDYYPTSVDLTDDNPERRSFESDYRYFESDYVSLRHLIYNEDLWLIPKDLDVTPQTENMVIYSAPFILQVGNTTCYASHQEDKAAPYPASKPLPLGAWSFEPDRLEFVSHNLPCLILRRNKGYLCGYVGLPFNHKLVGLDYDQISHYFREFHQSLPVELSYAQSHCFGDIDHFVSPLSKNAYYWVGFCVNYMSDLIPAEQGTDQQILPNQTYKDIPYVFGKCQKLSELFFKEA